MNTTNSQLSRAQQPVVFVLENQAIWSTAITSSELDCKVTRVLNLDFLLSQCGETLGSLAIIEIDLWDRRSSANNTFLALNSVIQRMCHCPFFAVGDKRLKKYHNQLLAVGFGEVLGGITTVNRLVHLARRHFAAVARPNLTIEERVRRSLPWRATHRNRLSRMQT